MTAAAQPEPGERLERAKTLFFDGLANFEAGRFDAAAERFTASLDLAPGRVSTLVNLAATELRRARPAAALALADEVLGVEPASVDAWFHRGTALTALGRHADALASYEALLGHDPDLAEPWFHRGQALQRLDRHADALAAYARALALDPAHAEAWSQRGTLLRELGRLDQAAAAFGQALAHGADPALHRYYLAAVGGSCSGSAGEFVDGRAARGPESPEIAPPAYVEALFDDYADVFDDHLRRLLRYRAPEVLAAPLAALHPERFRAAVDLGCGTGLCGPLVKPLADHLTGIDLSARMLEQAGRKGVYDRLVRGDLVAVLNGDATGDADDVRDAAPAGDAGDAGDAAPAGDAPPATSPLGGPPSHDLVIAADTFIYLGDLGPLFAAVRRRLAPGGVFCFSAEPAPDAGPGAVLLPSLRYAHSERHLLALAAEHDFAVAAVSRQPIREEQRRPVDALFVHLVRR